MPRIFHMVCFKSKEDQLCNARSDLNQSSAAGNEASRWALCTYPPGDEDPPGLDQPLVLPAGGQVAVSKSDDGITITWNRSSPL